VAELQLLDLDARFCWGVGAIVKGSSLAVEILRVVKQDDFGPTIKLQLSDAVEVDGRQVYFVI
jgi:hypothetical protein